MASKLFVQQTSWCLVARRLSFAASRPAATAQREYNEYANSRKMFAAAIHSVLPQNMVRLVQENNTGIEKTLGPFAPEWDYLKRLNLSKPFSYVISFSGGSRIFQSGRQPHR